MVLFVHRRIHGSIFFFLELIAYIFSCIGVIFFFHRGASLYTSEFIGLIAFFHREIICTYFFYVFAAFLMLNW
jgi:hypothetical protein